MRRVNIQAAFLGEGRIRIDEAPARAPGDGEVRLRVAACCLCGSDLRPWRRGWPVTPGHEIAGVVDQPGHARHGQRVLVYIPVYCGACAECLAGWTHLCRNANDLIGWQRPGGYAEHVNVPERCLLRLPDDVPIVSRRSGAASSGTSSGSHSRQRSGTFTCSA